MTGVFTPRKEILPHAQRRLWPALEPAARLGFVLYGGTAIALRLGHRTSVDFDFFTDRPLDRDALSRALPFLGDALVLQDRPESISMLTPCSDGEREHVKLSFFGGIDFGRVGEPDKTSDRILLVASLDDLMATKVKTLLQRVERKDYADVAAMVRAGVSLSKGLASARLMFGTAFQPSEALKALVFFEGGDVGALGVPERIVLVEAVKNVSDLPAVTLASRALAGPDVQP